MELQFILWQWEISIFNVGQCCKIDAEKKGGGRERLCLLELLKWELILIVIKVRNYLLFMLPVMCPFMTV